MEIRLVATENCCKMASKSPLPFLCSVYFFNRFSIYSIEFICWEFPFCFPFPLQTTLWQSNIAGWNSWHHCHQLKKCWIQRADPGRLGIWQALLTYFWRVWQRITVWSTRPSRLSPLLISSSSINQDVLGSGAESNEPIWVCPWVEEASPTEPVRHNPKCTSNWWLVLVVLSGLEMAVDHRFSRCWYIDSLLSKNMAVSGKQNWLCGSQSTHEVCFSRSWFYHVAAGQNPVPLGNIPEMTQPVIVDWFIGTHPHITFSHLLHMTIRCVIQRTTPESLTTWGHLNRGEGIATTCVRSQYHE